MRSATLVVESVALNAARRVAATDLRLSVAAANLAAVMMKLLRRHRDWLMIVIAILAIPFIFYFVQTRITAR